MTALRPLFLLSFGLKGCLLDTDKNTKNMTALRQKTLNNEVAGLYIYSGKLGGYSLRGWSLWAPDDLLQVTYYQIQGRTTRFSARDVLIRLGAYSAALPDLEHVMYSLDWGPTVLYYW